MDVDHRTRNRPSRHRRQRIGQSANLASQRVDALLDAYRIIQIA